MTRKIVVVPGDGVGKEVIPPAEEVLAHYLTDAEFVHLELGYERWTRCGSACTADDMAVLKESDAILFGAVTTPPTPAYPSLLLTIRHELDLYANLRPVRSGTTDILIVRENTEGLYSGIEEIGTDRATTLRVVTRAGSMRIAKKAAECARARESDRAVVIGYKGNVMKSDVLFSTVCEKVIADAGLSSRKMFIDALCLDVLMHPEKYDVIVTSNMFGDILSDVCGYLSGGLGMLPSANIGDRYAFFEPVHGSAPDIAGKGIANPIAAIRSAALMLEYFGMEPEAVQVEQVISSMLSAGMGTPDIGGSCSTKQFGAEVIRRIEQGA